MKTINIILPVYNEAEILNDFHEALSAVLRSLQDRYVFEIIYVLDKSSDHSLEILKKICDHDETVRLLGLSRRFGHQMSLVAGMDHCHGDAAIMMDSDLEHPPELIPQLLEKFEQGYDVVSTERLYPQQVSYLKKASSKIFYRLLKKISSIQINENSADFRLISKKVLTIFQEQIREQNQFLRGLFPWVGFNQTCVTFTSGYRQKGQSKYTLSRLFNLALAGVISFSKTPLKLSIIMGFVLALLSTIYGLSSVVMYLVDSQIPKGWTSLIAMMALLGGLQLIVLGMIGEYIGGIFDEVKRRPLYIVEEMYGKPLGKHQ